MTTVNDAVKAEALKIFKPYVEAVGRVAHTWNQLQENLGQIFADLMGGGHDTALAAWYAVRSDSGQRQMLLAVVRVSGDDRWPNRLPSCARDDVAWLIEQATALGSERNVAVHAPIGIAISEGALEIVPAYFYGNPLAEKVLKRGQGMMKELERCETWAAALNKFAADAGHSLKYPHATWPTRPVRKD